MSEIPKEILEALERYETACRDLGQEMQRILAAEVAAREAAELALKQWRLNDEADARTLDEAFKERDEALAKLAALPQPFDREAGIERAARKVADLIGINEDVDIDKIWGFYREGCLAEARAIIAAFEGER